MGRMRRALGVLLALVALPATALAAPERRGIATIEQLRAAHGAARLSGLAAGGDVTVSPAEGIASVTGTVRVAVRRGAGVQVGFPALFAQRAANARPFVRGTPSGGAVDSGHALAIDVSGLPAGTYRLPLRRGGRQIGTATFRLYVPSREGAERDSQAAGPFGPLERAAIDTSNDSTEESETFVAVDPADPNRIVTAANDIGGSGLGGVSVTSTGGATAGAWAHPQFPTTFDLKTPALGDTELPAGDPILAADDQGNLWAGGLSLCDPDTPGSRSHIFVNRIAAGTTTFHASNVAIPTLHDGASCPANPDDEVIQDKPQMTIDNFPASPTRGRIYVTWDDPDPNGGSNVVVSYCDSGQLVAVCDSADGWTNPVKVSDTHMSNGTPNGGSYISSDPAVGPDGKVYVAWWDFSAANAIRIDTCTPAAITLACDTWGTDRIVASLSSHLGRVPFACPTPAQPGGRAAPVPSLAVDATGRIYAAWSDLGTTGSTRCAFTGAGMTVPDATQDAFNSYVASAPTYDALTATASTPSGGRGTNVVGQPGDHWFPWVAVEPATGHAYVSLYSTRGDDTRRTAGAYLRAVIPDGAGTGVHYGPLLQASDVASDYSDQPCAGFGNDYGDYAGLAASSSDGLASVAFPVWDSRQRGAAGEVYLAALARDVSSPEAPADDPALPPVTQRYLPQCDPTPVPAPPPPPPPPATTPTTDATPPPAPLVDRTPPTLKVTFARRVDRRGRYTLRLRPAGEAAAGRATLRLAKGRRRKLASGLLATSGNRPLKLVIKLRRKDLRLLRRRHRLRVKLSVSLTDVAGNTARGSKTFTLRLRR
jgi:hypothetical protein